MNGNYIMDWRSACLDAIAAELHLYLFTCGLCRGARESGSFSWCGRQKKPPLSVSGHNQQVNQ